MWKHKQCLEVSQNVEMLVLKTIIYFHEMWKKTATLLYFIIFLVDLNLF